MSLHYKIIAGSHAKPKINNRSLAPEIANLFTGQVIYQIQSGELPHPNELWDAMVEYPDMRIALKSLRQTKYAFDARLPHNPQIDRHHSLYVTQRLSAMLLNLKRYQCKNLDNAIPFLLAAALHRVDDQEFEQLQLTPRYKKKTQRIIKNYRANRKRLEALLQKGCCQHAARQFIENGLSSPEELFFYFADAVDTLSTYPERLINDEDIAFLETIASLATDYGFEDMTSHIHSYLFRVTKGSSHVAISKIISKMYGKSRLDLEADISKQMDMLHLLAMEAGINEDDIVITGRVKQDHSIDEKIRKSTIKKSQFEKAFGKKAEDIWQVVLNSSITEKSDADKTRMISDDFYSGKVSVKVLRELSPDNLEIISKILSDAKDSATPKEVSFKQFSKVFGSFSFYLWGQFINSPLVTAHKATTKVVSPKFYSGRLHVRNITNVIDLSDDELYILEGILLGAKKTITDVLAWRVITAKEEDVLALLNCIMEHSQINASKKNSTGKKAVTIYGIKGSDFFKESKTAGHIVIDKGNQYQSIHIKNLPFFQKDQTVEPVQVELIDGEIQIRSEAMHYEAEFGQASHLAYKKKVDMPSEVGVSIEEKFSLRKKEIQGKIGIEFTEKLNGKEPTTTPMLVDVGSRHAISIFEFYLHHLLVDENTYPIFTLNGQPVTKLNTRVCAGDRLSVEYRPKTLLSWLAMNGIGKSKINVIKVLKGARLYKDIKIYKERIRRGNSMISAEKRRVNKKATLRQLQTVINRAFEDKRYEEGLSQDEIAFAVATGVINTEMLRAMFRTA